MLNSVDLVLRLVRVLDSTKKELDSLMDSILSDISIQQVSFSHVEDITHVYGPQESGAKFSHLFLVHTDKVNYFVYTKTSKDNTVHEVVSPSMCLSCEEAIAIYVRDKNTDPRCNIICPDPGKVIEDIRKKLGPYHM